MGVHRHVRVTMQAAARRRWAVAGDAALWCAAVLGVVCILAFFAAMFFGVRIVLFSTGSMSPTIPAGAAALSREIPAADIAVGDVITVDRPGRLPITHRVRSVEPVAGDPDARSIVMRGDANAVDDPAPYTVERAGLVVFAVPGIASALSSLRSPWVLGGVTLAATVLVVVACWPRRRGEPEADAPRSPPPSGAVVGSAVLAVGILAGVLAGAGPAGSAAAADPTVRIVQGSIIRLVSIESADMTRLVPGAAAAWQVGVSADAPTGGELTVTTSSSGDANLALRYDVEVCSEQWIADACAAPASLISDEAIPLDGAERPLTSLTAAAQAWLRITVRMPDTTDPAASGRVDLVVHVVGLGDDVSVGPGDDLAGTGGRVLWPLLPGAAVITAAGALLLVRRVRGG